MNTINLSRSINRLNILYPLLWLLLFSNCKPSNHKAFQLVDQALCDNFNNLVLCTEPKPERGIVHLKQTESKKELNSWDDFSNYLYFKARETPGFVLTFSRKFTDEERKQIRSSYSAYINIDGIREKMEGFELGEKTIASFHYLGATLKEWKRSKHQSNQRVDLEKLGNLLIQFEFNLPNGEKGFLTREIELKWE